VQVALVAVVAAVLGWHPHGSVPSVLLLVVVGTVAMAGLGLLLAGVLPALVTLAAANAAYLVLLLLGAVVLPGSELGPLEGLSRALPTGALAHGLRTVLLHGSGLPVRDLLTLLAWAVASLGLASVTFRWVEQLDATLFRGGSRDVTQLRAFGGQVIAQALVAAGRTVPADRPVHSLHAYFLRPGDPTVPLLLRVDRIRDGGSFTTRRVNVVQHGESILHLSASFHRPEPGFSHQVAVLDAPPPESLPTTLERLEGNPAAEGWIEELILRHPVELRFVDGPPLAAVAPQEPHQQLWFRATDPLGDDPLIHAAAVAYASDLSLLSSVLLAHGESWSKGEFMGTSLDHAMWFHGEVRADEWLLYDQESPWSGRGRGLTRGSILTRGGRLVASVVQEGLIRRIVARPPA
jgi:acyl-CoA thioesterase-2